MALIKNDQGYYLEVTRLERPLTEEQIAGCVKFGRYKAREEECYIAWLSFYDHLQGSTFMVREVGTT